MVSQDPHLRRKALQMFTRRLDPAAAGGAAPRLSPGEEYLFVEMVPSLRMVAMGRSTRSPSSGDNSDMESDPNLEEVMGPSTNEEEAEEESAVNRQTALLSLDVLARVLGRRHQAAFVGVVDDVTEIVAGVGPASLPGEGGDGMFFLLFSTGSGGVVSWFFPLSLFVLCWNTLFGISFPGVRFFRDKSKVSSDEFNLQ